jgi:hypothetical protein
MMLHRLVDPVAIIATAFLKHPVKHSSNEKPQLSQDTSRSNQAQQWMSSGQQDIARVIERTIAPYVDHGNVALQHDELRDECWFKVVKLLTSSTIDRCETRQQFFGLVKVSLRNHIRSLIHKHAFTSKRTGALVPPKGGTCAHTAARKAKYVRLDNPDESFEVAADTNAAQTDALLLDFANILSPSDQILLQQMLESDQDIDAAATRELRRRYDEFLWA